MQARAPNGACLANLVKMAVGLCTTAAKGPVWSRHRGRATTPRRGGKPKVGKHPHRGLQNNQTQLLAAIFAYQPLVCFNYRSGRKNAQIQCLLDRL